MIGDILLSTLAGFAGGLAVYGGAVVRHRINKKAALNRLSNMSGMQQAPQCKVILKGDKGVEAVYDGPDEHLAHRLYDETELGKGQEVQIFRDGKFRGKRTFGTTERVRI